LPLPLHEAFGDVSVAKALCGSLNEPVSPLEQAMKSLGSIFAFLTTFRNGALLIVLLFVLFDGLPYSKAGMVGSKTKKQNMNSAVNIIKSEEELKTHIDNAY